MSKYRIGVIVTWFGTLPAYFPLWLKSAEWNEDVDFLCFTDCEIRSTGENIKVHRTSLQESVLNFEKKLGRKVKITNSYKFCDCRAFFGILYEDYLKDYDFWGYCDIDLVFGNIRHFLTDDVLEQYDRIYQYGHLSLFRNNYEMNHLYDLPGGIYTKDEIFCGEAKTTAEEYFGINRICEKNSIRWYTTVDFADFDVRLTERLEATHGIENYDEQLFLWHAGRAYRVYREGDNTKEDDFIYMHWQKKKPYMAPEDMKDDSLFYVLTYDKIIVFDNQDALMEKNFQSINPALDMNARKKQFRMYFQKKIKEFMNSSSAKKKIWLREKFYKMVSGKTSYI